jgi:hypothetical protein
LPAEDYITVYSQSVAGGLPQNQVLPTVSEMKIATYTLDSALSFDKRYAAKSRMDVVSKTFTRLAQEILLKQEKTSANLILSALAAATTNGKKHVQRANTNGRFLLADLNELFTLAKRINTSWAKGTPEARGSRGLTDLIVSPEVVQELRAMAYNPINTKGVLATTPDGTNAGIAAPESVRVGLFNGGGVPSFYGVNLLIFNEFGLGRKFNTVFDTVASTTQWLKADGGYVGANAGSGNDFDGTKDELLLGINRNRESLIRAVATDGENGSEFSLIADDQYSIRQGKIGYFGSLEEGRMVLDTRALFGKIVKRS